MRRGPKGYGAVYSGLKRGIATMRAIVLTIVLLTSGVVWAADHPGNEEMALGVYKAFVHFVQCGDTVYSGTDGEEVWESKGVKFQVKADSLTAVDRANGITWQGYVYQSCTMQRRADEGGDWYSCERPLGVRVYKKQGKWNVDDGVERKEFLFDPEPLPSCAEGPA